MNFDENDKAQLFEGEYLLTIPRSTWFGKPYSIRQQVSDNTGEIFIRVFGPLTLTRVHSPSRDGERRHEGGEERGKK